MDLVMLLMLGGGVVVVGGAAVLLVWLNAKWAGGWLAARDAFLALGFTRIPPETESEIVAELRSMPEVVGSFARRFLVIRHPHLGRYGGRELQCFVLSRERVEDPSGVPEFQFVCSVPSEAVPAGIHPPDGWIFARSPSRLYLWNPKESASALKGRDELAAHLAAAVAAIGPASTTPA